MKPETSIYEYARQGLLASPNKPALWFYDRSISYTQLFEMIDNAADHLYRLGIHQGTVVTIHLPNCPQAVIAIYAVAKLGGICNMVHSLIPLEGLRNNMEFTESSVLITGSHFSDVEKVDFADTLLYATLSYHMGFPTRQLMQLKNKAQKPTSAIVFEQLELPCEEKAVIPPQESLSETCVCYLHSSGTTGKPKTVMHSHRNLNRFVARMRIYFTSMDISTQICLSVLPWYHGLGLVVDVHRVINGGGQLAILIKWNAKKAVHYIKKHRINILLGVPSMYHMLMAQPGFRGRRISQIRQCMVGGDRVDPRVKKQIDLRIGNGHHMTEGYGLSEITVCSCVIPLSNYHESATGYPLKDYLTAVITEDGSLAYSGMGELVVSTDCMMLGYLKDPEATENAFFYADGRKWLHTGDLGKVDDEGYVFFLGRMKNTIVHNGYNVYPHEIETVIKKNKKVKDACVIGIFSEKKHTQIVRACVIPAGNVDTELLERELRESCTQTLPAFSVPEQYRFMEVFPTNAMGKIDRGIMERSI